MTLEIYKFRYTECDIEKYRRRYFSFKFGALTRKLGKFKISQLEWFFNSKFGALARILGKFDIDTNRRYFCCKFGAIARKLGKYKISQLEKPAETYYYKWGLITLFAVMRMIRMTKYILLRISRTRSRVQSFNWHYFLYIVD